jgi:hypothetical protein
VKRMGTIVLWLSAIFSINCSLQHVAAPSESLAPSVSSAQTEQNDFQVFWSEFRAAIKANDRQKIASLTAFPFKTRGTDDGDPVVRRDRASFLRILDRLLDDDPGLSQEPDKMRLLIERKAEINSKELREISESGGQARIGDFVFEKVKGKWVFTFAYLDE